MTVLKLEDVPDELLGRLSSRAARFGRTPGDEALVLIAAALEADEQNAGALAAAIRGRLAGRTHSDSAVLLAKDRGR